VVDFANDSHMFYTKGEQLIDDISDTPLSPGRLPTGQCHGAIVEQEEGDIYLPLHTTLNRAAPAVKEAAIAQILIDVLIAIKQGRA
jgi:hypothetical protein